MLTTVDQLVIRLALGIYLYHTIYIAKIFNHPLEWMRLENYMIVSKYIYGVWNNVLALAFNNNKWFIYECNRFEKWCALRFYCNISKLYIGHIYIHLWWCPALYLALTRSAGNICRRHEWNWIKKKKIARYNLVMN